MRSPWDALFEGITRSVSSPRASAAFSKMRAADPEHLSQFANPGDVVFALTEVGGALSLDDKDRVLAALVRASARADVGDVAVSIMLAGLWPGLSLLFARLLRFYGGRKVDLAADIV
jgi:hypothetical protein